MMMHGLANFIETLHCRETDT